ncbi:MAG: DUF4827 domain-containing protein [Muribaculaceae bacterium]|nr:DUF4827 domain-containing protein [Muribaculaceae bacterium]MDE6119463.1 DUF4827 domain-containing protein [Muribaculaceae bacterium]MDE6315496.1 DUF4827 domain-containing protein [Muribaculaceae bacterium]
MNKIIKSLTLVAVAGFSLCSCNDGKSYAEMLRDETESTNYYLSSFQVINAVPADSVFVSVADMEARGLSREDALAVTPFYRLDDDGDVYMQVVNPGTGEKAEDNQLIYFRFNRSNLNYYYSDGVWISDGNATDLGTEPSSFRYNNYSLESSYTWGSGLQMPLRFLRLNCEVNLVVKSTVGLVSEQSSVVPYLYNVRYYPSRI